MNSVLCDGLAGSHKEMNRYFLVGVFLMLVELSNGLGPGVSSSSPSDNEGCSAFHYWRSFCIMVEVRPVRYTGTSATSNEMI